MTKKGFVIGILSSSLLILGWYIVALFIASPLILPNPHIVFFDSINLIKEPEFCKMLITTCYRGIIAFSISLICSFCLGFIAGIHPSFESALKPWMTTIKSTPVVSFILIALLWFGSSKVPIFVSVLMTLPILTEAIAQGVKSSDTKLLEMAHTYHLKRRAILLNIQLPSAMPYFLAGAGASLGLTWKVVVAGEILSSPRYGIGSAMQTAKLHLETPRVFSLTITAIFLSIVTELLFNFFIFLSTRHNKIDGAM